MKRYWKPLLAAAGLFSSITVANVVSSPPVAEAATITSHLDVVDYLHNNMVLVRGWAIHNGNTSNKVKVRVRVDGSTYHFPQNNWRIADEHRPDVGNVYPAWGDYHGFELRVPMNVGSHTICVDGHSSQGWTVIGCATETNNNTFNTTYQQYGSRWYGRLFEQTEGQNIEVQYRYTASSTSWDNQIEGGTEAWNAGTTRITMDEATSSEVSDIRFYVLNMNSTYSSGVGGVTLFNGGSCSTYGGSCAAPVLSGSPFTTNRIYLNSGNAVMSSDPVLREDVVEHEVGHALGLGHNVNPGFPVLMHPVINDPDNSRHPTTWETQSINIAYP